MDYLLVGLGGMAGALARYGVDRIWAGSAFPWGILIINLSGALALGFFLELAVERSILKPQWRLAIATGFLGAYTTFSTLMGDVLRLLQEGRLILALIDLGGSILLGLVAAWLGMVGARKIQYRASGQKGI